MSTTESVSLSGKGKERVQHKQVGMGEVQAVREKRWKEHLVTGIAEYGKNWNLLVALAGARSKAELNAFYTIHKTEIDMMVGELKSIKAKSTG